MCRFGDAPKSRQPRVYRHPPCEGVIRVPGCSWKATAQVTPTISQGTFSVQFTAQVALESFIPTLPGTGHFWLPTLALSPGNHVQKLLSKPALVLSEATWLRVSPPPNTLGRGHPRPSRVWGRSRGARWLLHWRLGRSHLPTSSCTSRPSRRRRHRSADPG